MLVISLSLKILGKKTKISIICCLIATFFFHIANAQDVDADSTLHENTFVSNSLPLQVADSATLDADYTTRKNSLTKEYFRPDPTKATFYALVCPGLGQIYNRSYWKVPIVYGGIVTLGYLIAWNGRTYNDYRNAYHDRCDSDPNTRSYVSIVSNPSEAEEEWVKKALKRKSDTYRRYRDMSIFGMVALYILSVVDSFVDAHLYDFTVSDDLSLKMEPIIKPFEMNESQYSPTIYGVQCSITF